MLLLTLFYDYSAWSSKKSKYNSKLILENGVQTPLVEHYDYKLKLLFSRSALVMEQNNYKTSILNAQIFSDLNSWSRNRSDNFTLKNWLFGITNIKKVAVKVIGSIMVMEQHLMEKVGGAFGNDFATNANFQRNRSNTSRNIKAG